MRYMYGLHVASGLAALYLLPSRKIEAKFESWCTSAVAAAAAASAHAAALTRAAVAGVSDAPQPSTAALLESNALIVLGGAVTTLAIAAAPSTDVNRCCY